jgi:hypothetical protein
MCSLQSGVRRVQAEARLTSLASGQADYEKRQDLFVRHRSLICLALQSLFDAKEACAVMSKAEQTTENEEIFHEIRVL